jgi:RNA polymerase sigma-70 factor (ECF subfamily)
LGRKGGRGAVGQKDLGSQQVIGGHAVANGMSARGVDPNHSAHGSAVGRSRVRAELQAMSADFAQESVIIILQKLDQFAGRSKFTTWAARIAVHQALGELRRARWRDVSLQAVTLEGAYEPDFLRREEVVTPEGSAIQQEAMDVVMDVMQNELSERQSRALYARMVLDMPSDMLAQELGVSHNTLYKLIHDARKRLKARLLQRGLSPDDILSAFQ